MLAVDRHEKTRANWLLANEATWTMADRRMANELQRRAAKKDHAESGAADSAHHEGRIPWIGARWIARGDDQSEKGYRAVFVYAVALPLIAALIGPALALSAVLYFVTTLVLLQETRLPRKVAWLQGQRIPRAWPWLVAAAVTAVAGALILDIGSVATVSPAFVVDVAWDRVVMLCLVSQLVLALALVGWTIRRHGWPGVSRKTALRTPSITGRSMKEKSAAVAAVRPETGSSTDGPKAPSLRRTDEEPDLIGGDEDLDEGEEPVFPDEDEEWAFDEVEVNNEGEKS